MKFKVRAYIHGYDTYEVEAETHEDAIQLVVDNNLSIPCARRLVYYNEEIWTTETVE